VKPEAEIRDLLDSGLKSMGLLLNEEARQKLLRFFELLLIQNKTLNLISPKQSLPEKVGVHLLDSLSPLLLNRLPSGGRMMDFGSGGGFPGIPLSIVLDYQHFDLIEATGKKTRFLSTVLDDLKLSHVSIVNKYLNPNRNEENIFYDFISARAVSALKNIAAIAGPRLSSQGYFLAFKGPQADQELSEARSVLVKFKLNLLERLDFNLPLVEVQRSLLLFQKS